jgi:hypothetical protein
VRCGGHLFADDKVEPLHGAGDYVDEAKKNKNFNIF